MPQVHFKWIARSMERDPFMEVASVFFGDELVGCYWAFSRKSGKDPGRWTFHPEDGSQVTGFHRGKEDAREQVREEVRA